MSTKFFGTGITIISAWYISIILSEAKKKLIHLTLALPVSLIILLSTYIKVLFTNYPLSQFLGIQKWVFLYNKGHLHFPFSVWQLLLFNRWYTWWGDNKILSDSQWNFAWPIIVVLSLFTIIIYIFRKIPKKRGIEALMAWVVFYLSFLSLSDASVRYFVILLPILYLISVFGLENVILSKTKGNH